ncbi:MAG: hypothetical protein ABIA21_03640 [Candidatus Aenigmatarchaeota archaeon]
MAKRKGRRSKKTQVEAQPEQPRKSRMHTCKRCGAEFALKDELDIHNIQIHMTKIAMAEMKLLGEGFIPNETKHGLPFKGKNRIIIV